MSETATTRAEREPQSDFAFPNGHARDEQVDDVRARDEEQKRRGAEQHHQRPAHLPHELFVQRNDLGVRHPRLVAVLLFEPARQRAQIGLGLLERDAVVQPCDRPPPAGRSAAAKIWFVRRPQIVPRRIVHRLAA